VPGVDVPGIDVAGDGWFVDVAGADRAGGS